MPPAVALWNYISCGYTLADFFPNWDISRGFLYVCIIYIAGRISAAVMAGDIILIKKNKTKIVRTYGRTGKYMNFDPK